MKTQFIGSNVVIAARQFNPSIFSQHWLIKNNILSENEFEGGSVFADTASQANTKKFHLLVIPPQLQFAPKTTPTDEQAVIVESLGKIISLLPQTPFTAAGLNFTWHVTSDKMSISELTRSLFYKGDGPIHKRFDSLDSRFGAYLSKDFEGTRLRLNIKPIRFQEQPFQAPFFLVQDATDFPTEGQDRIQFSFNFHKDFVHETDVVTSLQDVLKKWDLMRAEAKSILETMD